jgi:hypothetical protein
MARVALVLLLVVPFSCRSNPPAAVQPPGEHEPFDAAAAEERTWWGCRVSGNTIACRFPPPVDAHVLAVSEDDQHVTLSKGSADGIQVGFPFTVFRHSTYCGMVRVESVEEHRSRAVITFGKAPFAAGDRATTRL